MHSDRDLRDLYWRGATYTRYMGRGFAPPNAGVWLTPQDAAGKETSYRGISRDFVARNPHAVGFVPPTSPFELPPSEMKGRSEGVLEVEVLGQVTQMYGAGEIESVLVDLPGVNYDPLSGIYTDQPLDQGSHYLVRSAIVTADEGILRASSSARSAIPQPIQDTCLQRAINGVENPRLQRLALQITHSSHTTYDKALAIQHYVGKRCRYSLYGSMPPSDGDLVEWFLFDSRQGDCKLFAAAVTMLCRYADIPARIATGFTCGDPSGPNTYTVREKHRHAWCEVFLPRIGWTALDATGEETPVPPPSTIPPRPKRTPLLAHGRLLPLTGFVVLSLVAYLIGAKIASRLRHKRIASYGGLGRPSSNMRVIQLYADACMLLARRGLPRDRWMTPDEYHAYLTGRCVGTEFDIDGLIGPLTQMYAEYRYGPAVAAEAEVARARALIVGLRRGVGGLPRRSTRRTTVGQDRARRHSDPKT